VFEGTARVLAFFLSFFLLAGERYVKKYGRKSRVCTGARKATVQLDAQGPPSGNI